MNDPGIQRHVAQHGRPARSRISRRGPQARQQPASQLAHRTLAGGAQVRPRTLLPRLPDLAIDLRLRQQVPAPLGRHCGLDMVTDHLDLLTAGPGANVAAESNLRQRAARGHRQPLRILEIATTYAGDCATHAGRGHPARAPAGRGPSGTAEPAAHGDPAGLVAQPCAGHPSSPSRTRCRSVPSRLCKTETSPAGSNRSEPISVADAHRNMCPGSPPLRSSQDSAAGQARR